MHRQAMLVSLSLSPASTAAKNDKHWAFLAEIDAPQWADLRAEEALAGTIGDDPWFYRSHTHHEVPLTELTGGTDSKDRRGSVRTPQIERKKRASTKTKLAFESQTLANSHKDSKEELNDSSPKANFNPGFNEAFEESPGDQIGSPIQCKSPEGFTSSRRFISSTPTDMFIGGNHVGAVFDVPNAVQDNHMSENASGNFNAEACIPVSSTPSSAAVSGDEDRPSAQSAPWIEAMLPRLNDMRRLRKSLGSALRVKIDGSADSTGTERREAGALPKSRLVHQSVQLETPAMSQDVTCEKVTTSCIEKNGEAKTSPELESSKSCAGLVSKLGTNSSVHAFDDIRRMRKSWGSALRVKIDDGPDISQVDPDKKGPAVSEETTDVATGPISALPEDCAVDSPSDRLVEPVISSVVTSSVVSPPESKSNEKSSEDQMEAVSSVAECAVHNVIESMEELDLVKSLEVFSPQKVAAGPSKTYRRSVSFDHTHGNVSDNTFTLSGSAQQRPTPRASQSVQSHGPVHRLIKVNRTSKGGKENTSIQSPPKLKPSLTGPTVSVAKKGRQSVLRMSMPSLTFTAHARASSAGSGGSILKPTSNGVGEPSKANICKPTASSARKSVSGLDSVSRKKATVPSTTVTDAPSKMVTRQSALRSSMPAFSAAAFKQGSKPANEIGSAAAQADKKAVKTGNGGDDLATLLAEHNRKFRPKPKYEPRIHSVKDIREWETRTGQMFYNLPPAQREKANQEITAAKQMRH